MNKPTNWDELELIAERVGPSELEQMKCPSCDGELSVQYTEDRRAVRISCETCSEETVICDLPNQQVARM